MFLAIPFGINFLGIKFILYYALFYGIGWLCKWTETWWQTHWIRISNFAVFISLIIFLFIVFNYDIYKCEDDYISIMLRCISGFTGNIVLFEVCRKFKIVLSKIRLAWLGTYTLEIYVTHVNVVNLMKDGSMHSFFSVLGFANFLFSLLLAIVLTTIIVMVIKAIPIANLIFYGKK